MGFVAFPKSDRAGLSYFLGGWGGWNLLLLWEKNLEKWYPIFRHTGGTSLPSALLQGRKCLCSDFKGKFVKLGNVCIVGWNPLQGDPDRVIHKVLRVRLKIH